MFTKNADKSAVVIQWLLFLLLLMTIQFSPLSSDTTGLIQGVIAIPAIIYQYCFFKRESGGPTSGEVSSDQVPTQLQEATSPVANFPIKQLHQDGLGHDDVETNSPQPQEQQGLVPSVVATQEPDPATALVGTKKKKPRLIFLDNVKVFLTAMVVLFHCACAFGACTKGSMPLIIGQSTSMTLAKKILMRSVLTINTVYFMPLFFFISAYFVSSSYKKKGGAAFRLGRRKRILYPFLFTMFLFTPGLIALGQYVARQHNPDEFTMGVTYKMNPGPTWFLLWLLLLNWVYTSIVEATPSSGENEEQMPFPGTVKRMAYGVALGLILQFSLHLLERVGTFAFMPLTEDGSFTNQMFMFYLGFVAKKNGWLEKDLTEQLDISLPLHLCLVLFEYAARFALDGGMYAPASPSFLSNFWVETARYVIGSMLTLDMSLAVLMVFQKWFNWENNFTKKLARSAYAVYLIHVAIILLLEWIFIAIYKDDLVFYEDNGFPMGEGLTSFVGGYVVVSVAAQLVVWPVSYALTRLPYLRDII